MSVRSATKDSCKSPEDVLQEHMLAVHSQLEGLYKHCLASLQALRDEKRFLLEGGGTRVGNGLRAEAHHAGARSGPAAVGSGAAGILGNCLCWGAREALGPGGRLVDRPTAEQRGKRRPQLLSRNQTAESLDGILPQTTQAMQSYLAMSSRLYPLRERSYDGTRSPRRERSFDGARSPRRAAAAAPLADMLAWRTPDPALLPRSPARHRTLPAGSAAGLAAACRSPSRSLVFNTSRVASDYPTIVSERSRSKDSPMCAVPKRVRSKDNASFLGQERSGQGEDVEQSRAATVERTSQNSCSVLDEKVVSHARSEEARSMTSWDPEENFAEIRHSSQPPDEGRSWAKRFVIKPMSPCRLLWDLAGFLLICYDLIAFPLQAFGPTPEDITETMQWVSAVFWLIDMPSQFFLAYPKAGGILEDNPRNTCKRYLKTWFGFDVTVLMMDWGFLVFGLQESFMSTVRSGKVIRFFRVLRGVRIFRISEYIRLYEFVQDLMQSQVLVLTFRIWLLLVILLVINHFLCCCWYFIGYSTGPESWINSYFTVTGEPVGQESVSYRYAMSLHWSLCQFTPASMEIYPINQWERWFSVFAILLGMVSFSSFVSQITASIGQIRQYRAEQAQQEHNLRMFISQNNIKNELSSRIWMFMRSSSSARSHKLLESSVKLLQELPHRLLEEIHVQMFSEMLVRHPLFGHLKYKYNNAFVSVCDTSVNQCFVLANHDLFRKGQLCHTMYFISKGQLRYLNDMPSQQLRGVHSESENGNGEGNLVQEKDWICEAALWMDFKHTESLMAVDYCEVFRIDKDKFHEATNEIAGVSEYQENFCEIDTLVGGNIDTKDVQTLVHRSFPMHELDLYKSIESQGSIFDGFYNMFPQRRHFGTS